MYSNNDYERLFLRYKAGTIPAGVSIQTFCNSNKVPYNLFLNWYKNTRHKVVNRPVETGHPVNETKVEKAEESYIHPSLTDLRIQVQELTSLLLAANKKLEFAEKRASDLEEQLRLERRNRYGRKSQKRKGKDDGSGYQPSVSRDKGDGYNVYMYLDDKVLNVNHLCCIAHMRAKFQYGFEQGDKDAEFFLDCIGEFYRLEDEYKKGKLSSEQIANCRQELKTKEIIIRMRSKLDALLADDHPIRGELMEKAIRYLKTF